MFHLPGPLLHSGNLTQLWNIKNIWVNQMCKHPWNPRLVSNKVSEVWYLNHLNPAFGCWILIQLDVNWLVVSNIWIIFHKIWDVILPIDELHHFIFFKMVKTCWNHQPVNKMWLKSPCFFSLKAMARPWRSHEIPSSPWLRWRPTRLPTSGAQGGRLCTGHFPANLSRGHHWGGEIIGRTPLENWKIRRKHEETLGS